MTITATKRGAVAFIAGCVAATATGCRVVDATADEEGIQIAYFAVDANNSYSQATLSGIQKVAKKADAQVTVFDGKFDVFTQLSQIDSAIASSEYDGFIIHPTDNLALVGSVKNAIEAGIAVGTTNLPIGPKWDTTRPQIPGLAASVLTPAQKVGASLADLTAKACADLHPCEVAYLLGGKQYALDTHQKTGFDAEISQYPSIEVEAVLVGGYSTDRAYAATQNALQAHPGLDVLTSNADGMAQGAQRAIAAAGASVKLIGNGGSALAYKGIKAGTWFGSSMLLPVTEGKVVAANVIKAVKTGVLSLGRDVTDNSPIGLALTAETLARFTPEWDG